jgi:hypothetical protein
MASPLIFTSALRRFALVGRRIGSRSRTLTHRVDQTADRTPSTLNEVVAQPAAGPVNLGSLGPASPRRAALCPTDLRWIPHGFSRCCIFAAAGKKTLRTGTPSTAHDCNNARRACSSGDVEVSPASCGCGRTVTRVPFLIEGLPMPIEHLKRLQKHFDLCILRAPEHEESEWFRRWRNCVGHMIDFPGMSFSAAWDASNPARYKAHTAPL